MGAYKQGEIITNTGIWNDSKKEAERDWRADFQTPLFAAKYMVGMVPLRAKTALEPTPGQGTIVGLLQERGLQVTAPDDYFLLDKTSRFDCIVMNPPFSSRYANIQNAPGDYSRQGMRLGYQILKECMEMSDRVIALMPWFTISDSDVRMRYLARWGLKSITALPRRTFDYSRIQTIVLELVKGWELRTQFKVYDIEQHDHQLKFDLQDKP